MVTSRLGYVVSELTGGVAQLCMVGAGGQCPEFWYVGASASTPPWGWLALLGACVDPWNFLGACCSALCH